MNPFPEFNLDKLKSFAERWVQRFQKHGGRFGRIVLYRYVESAFQGKTSLRWAIVFDITHFEQPIAKTPAELLKKSMGSVACDPYNLFIWETGYKQWHDDRNTEPKKNPDKELDPICLYGKKFLEQSGFTTPPVALSKEMVFPQNLFENDFSDVYVDGAPDNWQHQWLFVPMDKDCPFSDHILTNESLILYDNLPDLKPTRDIIVVASRTEIKERATWNRWIKPIIDMHLNGSIEYRFFDKPEKITQGDIDRVWIYSLSTLSRYPGMQIQGEGILKEVMDRLRAGFKQHVGNDLVKIFYDFLIGLMDAGALPAFLAHIHQERHEPSVFEHRRKQPQFEIHTPLSTTWNQIHFRIVHSDRIEVTHPNGMTPFSPDEIGLLRKRRLHHLFKKFAHEEYQVADRQDIYNLNKFLKGMFPDIDDGNPIIKNRLKKKSLKEKKEQLKLKHPIGYTPVFSIKSE